MIEKTTHYRPTLPAITMLMLVTALAASCAQAVHVASSAPAAASATPVEHFDGWNVAYLGATGWPVGTLYESLNRQVNNHVSALFARPTTTHQAMTALAAPLTSRSPLALRFRLTTSDLSPRGVVARAFRKVV